MKREWSARASRASTRRGRGLGGRRAAYREREPVAGPRRHVRALALAAAVVAVVAAAFSAAGPRGRRLACARSDRRRARRRRALHAAGAGAAARAVRRADRGSSSPTGRSACSAGIARVVVAARPLPRRAIANGDSSTRSSRRAPCTGRSRSGNGVAFAALVVRGVPHRVLRRHGLCASSTATARAMWSSAPWIDRCARVAAGDARGRRRHAKRESCSSRTRDTRVVSRRLDRRGAVRALHWSTYGRELLVTRARPSTRTSASGRTAASLLVSKPGTVSSTAFRPGTHEFALAYRDPTHPDRSLVCLERRSRVVVRGGVRHVHGGGCVHVFEGAASFPSLTWSPNGRWLLVAWPAADQYVFVRVGTAPKLTAVSDVSRQFHSSTRFPMIAGWVG